MRSGLGCSVKEYRRSLLRSFGYAFSGLGKSIYNERNMRIHLSVMLIVMYFMRFYQLTRAETALLILTFTLVIALELVNTAIESVTDKASPEFSREAKIAKDTAAGAVLVAAIGAVIVGLMLFLDITTIKTILVILITNMVELVCLILLVIICLCFILFVGKPPSEKK